ncbi:MAG: hypothetical protein ACI867_000044 [Glaciecola sp.]
MKFDTSFTVPGKTPEACFDYITDPDHGTEWAGSAKEVRAEGDPGVGRKIIAKVNMILDFEITQTVTTFDRPTRYVFSATSPMKVAYDFRLEAAGEGTRVSCDLDADPGKFIPGGSLLLKGKFKKEFNNDMASLEKALANL